ncbi:MAG: YdcF family protein [Notoacmeibacter sp.]|nr:YdcF family protein [Notoacmeibacter sp.]
MFFYLSKTLWFLIQPLGVLFVLVALAGFAGWRGRGRLAAGLCLAALGVIAVAGWTNLGQMMLSPLEERFRKPVELPETVAGIIVLGGGLAGAVNLARGGYEMEDAGDRFLEAAVLARRLPDATIVISGGTGSLIASGEGDAVTAERLLGALGVAKERLVLETGSRNTAENAAFTASLLGARAGERWLLVTSAFHMPRSMALFRKAGVNVIAWPVDYRTPGPRGLALAGRAPVTAMDELTLAVREWTGLLAYWMTGRIDQPFPSP